MKHILQFVGVKAGNETDALFEPCTKDFWRWWYAGLAMAGQYANDQCEMPSVEDAVLFADKLIAELEKGAHEKE